MCWFCLEVSECCGMKKMVCGGEYGQFWWSYFVDTADLFAHSNLEQKKSEINKKKRQNTTIL